MKYSSPIQEQRAKAGYTQENIARKLNISLKGYQKIEYYQSKPNVILAMKLIDIIGGNLEELFQEELYLNYNN